MAHSIRDIQAKLTQLDYNPGPIDGKNGPQTKAAVRKFQQDHGLAVDGIVGPLTDAKLFASSAPPATGLRDSGPVGGSVASDTNVEGAKIPGAARGWDELRQVLVREVPEAVGLLFRMSDDLPNKAR